MSDLKVKDDTKIEVSCCDCGKKFNTTQSWFDNKNKDGKLKCRKCRTNITTDTSNAKNDTTKIELSCSECGKEFKTTQGWFDALSIHGKMPCVKCRTSIK